MHRISRVYIGNYGHKMCWYDGMLFNFVDQDTSEATDCIIQLENGGGKSTLLSGLFSCFDTAQNRFLKHLQNNKNKFTDYFSPDGLPGFILFEWMIPVASSQQQRRIVTGQVVAIKNRFTWETERIFFSFETAPDLALESVPAPKLGAEPCLSIDDFTRWLARIKKEYKGNVYDTRNQNDWEQHLQNERGIDVGMLKLQVEFSKLEGSIDTAFLNFKNETEFLQRFLFLTMDQEQAAIVRTSVLTACDKLKRKPEFEKRLSILTELLDRLTAFEVDADAMMQAKEVFAKCDFEMARFASALSAKVQAHNDQAQMCQEEIVQLRAREVSAKEERSRLADLNDGFNYLSLKHALQDASTNLETAKATENSIKEKISYLNAAKQLGQIDAIKSKCKDLSATVQLAEQGLQPFRERASTQGKILKDLLEFHRAKALSETAELHRQAQEQHDKRTELKRREADLSIRIRNEEKQLAQLQIEQSRYESSCANWIKSGVLHEGERLSQALERLSDDINVTQESITNGETEVESCHKAIKAAQKRMNAAQQEITQREELSRSLKKELAAVESLREGISQDLSLCRAAELESVDPDSEKLPALAEKYIRALQKTRDSLAVKVAQLYVDRAEIEQTGLAGSDPDVQKLLAALAELGIKSAGAFNLYIANTEPNKERARTLVCSDPSKFLGVAIKTEKELELAREILSKRLNLSKPVMVSLIANSAAEIKEGFVVPAEHDAAFHFNSATAYAKELDELIQQQNSSYEEFNKLATEAISSHTRLLDYRRDYGKSYVQERSTQIAEINAELVDLNHTVEDLNGEISAQENLRKESEEQLRGLRDQLSALTNNQALLHRDCTELETDLEKRCAEIEQIRKKLPTLIEQREDAIQFAEEAYEAQKNLEQAERDRQRHAEDLNNEKQKIRYCDESFNTTATLAEGISLPNARESYASAESHLDYKERDQLGVVKKELDDAEKHLSERTKEYQDGFSKLEESRVRSLIFLDISTELEKCSLELDDAESQKTQCIETRAQADSAFKSYKRTHPHAEKLSEPLKDTPRSEVQEQLSALPEQISLCEKDLADIDSAIRERHQEMQVLTTSAALLDNSATQLKASTEYDSEIEPNLSLIPSDTAQVTSITSGLIKSRKEANKKFESLSGVAQRTYNKLEKATQRPELAETDPEIAIQLQNHQFEEACAGAGRLKKGVFDRVAVAQDMLESLKADFDATVEELSNLVLEGIRILNSACNKRLPEKAPYLGGKPVIRMKANLSTTNTEHRRQTLESFLDDIIKGGFPHKNGTDMVADAIQRIAGKNLGITIAKLIREETEQYASADKLSNSGGEAVSMALFLYILTAQIRAETQADRGRQPGGPLILDNPFAKASSPFIWRAQRAFARAMGVQLIFATPTKDVETLAEFDHFICLRKAGQNTKTGRYHIEQVDLSLVGKNER